MTTIATCVLLTAAAGEAQATVDASPDRRAEPEEVHFRSGDLTLRGLFFLPEGEGPFPAAVFIPGSGPSSRDNQWARSFVDVVVESGVAVLLPDKRGSDGSEGDWRTASFSDLADDARAAVTFARSRPEVIGNRVGLVGLSQGGIIAPIAAVGDDTIAFVIDIVGSATNLKEQVRWEMYHTYREAGVEGVALQEGLRLQLLAEGYVEGRVDWETYETARLAASSGPGAAVAEGFPATPDAWTWDFFRRIADFDPIPCWRKVTQPVLVIYGEDDPNAPSVASAYRLIELWHETDHADATVRIIPNAGHALWEPGPHSGRRVLHPEVVALVREWITRRTRSDLQGGETSQAAVTAAP